MPILNRRGMPPPVPGPMTKPTKMHHAVFPRRVCKNQKQHPSSEVSDGGFIVSFRSDSGSPPLGSNFRQSADNLIVDCSTFLPSEQSSCLTAPALQFGEDSSCCNRISTPMHLLRFLKCHVDPQNPEICFSSNF